MAEPALRGGTPQPRAHALAVPAGSLAYWRERLLHHGVTPAGTETRLGERVMPFCDPHGLHLALVETHAAPDAPRGSGSTDQLTSVEFS